MKIPPYLALVGVFLNEENKVYFLNAFFRKSQALPEVLIFYDLYFIFEKVQNEDFIDRPVKF